MSWVYRLQLRHSIFRFVAPAIAVAAGVLAWTGVYPATATHANITDVLVSTVAVIAPVVSGFAAWDGLRDRRNGGSAVLDVAEQPRSRVLLVQAAAGITYSLGIYVFLLGLLYLRALILGFPLFGSPLWVNLAIPAVVMALFTLLGYILALLLRHWGAVIIAAAVPLTVYGFSLFGLEAGLLYNLTPFGNRAGNDFLDPNTPFFIGQLLFALGVAFLLLGILAAASRADRLTGIVGSVVALALIISGVVLVDRQDNRWGNVVTDIEARLTRHTSDSGSLRIYMLPTYDPVAADIVATWARVQGIVSASEYAFEELRQLRLGHPPQAEGGAPLEVVYLNPASNSIASDSVMESLLDMHGASCQISSTFATTLVDFWLAGRGSESYAILMPEHQEMLDNLRALDAAASTTWFAENADDYVNCSIAEDALPRG